MGDPREALADAEAAFIGEYLSSRPGEPPSGSSDDDTIYTFDVAEGFKVDLPDPLDVHSAANGASCGLEGTPGNTYAYFLYIDENGNWASNLCRQVGPDELRRAAAPLPEPDGENPVRFLAGGGYGEGRMVALDERGRTLGYGFGEKDAGWLDACPGGKRSVEVISNKRGDKLTLIVRRLSDFEEIRTSPLPFRRYSMRRPMMSELLCRDRRARSVLAFATTYDRHSRSRLIDVTPDGYSDLHRGSTFGAHLTETHAYLASGTGGRKIREVDLSDGSVRDIVDLGHPYVSGLAVNRTGRYLSALKDVYGDGKPGHIYVIDIDTGTIVAKKATGERRGLFAATTTWLRGNRILVLPAFSDNYHGEVYDLDLKLIDRFRWSAYEGVAWRGAAYGIDAEGWLVRAELPNGPAERVRRMVSRGVGGLTVVPGRTEMNFEMPDEG
jgi:hypothetical protein